MRLMTDDYIMCITSVPLEEPPTSIVDAVVDLKFLSLFLIDKEIVWTYIVIKNVS